MAGAGFCIVKSTICLDVHCMVSFRKAKGIEAHPKQPQQPSDHESTPRAGDTGIAACFALLKRNGDFKTANLVATLPGACYHRVSAHTGWSSVSSL